MTTGLFTGVTEELLNIAFLPTLKIHRQAEIGVCITLGQEYEMNLYNKGVGGNGFKMTTAMLVFDDVAYSSFEIK